MKEREKKKINLGQSLLHCCLRRDKSQRSMRVLDVSDNVLSKKRKPLCFGWVGGRNNLFVNFINISLTMKNNNFTIEAANQQFDSECHCQWY